MVNSLTKVLVLRQNINKDTVFKKQLACHLLQPLNRINTFKFGFPFLLKTPNGLKTRDTKKPSVKNVQPHLKINKIQYFYRKHLPFQIHIFVNANDALKKCFSFASLQHQLQRQCRRNLLVCMYKSILKCASYH